MNFITVLQLSSEDFRTIIMEIVNQNYFLLDLVKPKAVWWEIQIVDKANKVFIFMFQFSCLSSYWRMKVTYLVTLDSICALLTNFITLKIFAVISSNLCYHLTGWRLTSNLKWATDLFLFIFCYKISMPILWLIGSS